MIRSAMLPVASAAALAFLITAWPPVRAAEPTSAAARAEAAFAQCFSDPFDRVACETARRGTAGLQFESGAAPNVVYRDCDTKRGVCLELASLRVRRKLKDKSIMASLETLIVFELNSYRIEPAERKFLDAIVRATKARPNRAYNIAIVGHTDALGSDAANCSLSRNRAAAVRDYFVSQDIAPERLRIFAAGETLLRFPKAPLAKGNRRVAFAKITPRARGVAEKLSRLCPER